MKKRILALVLCAVCVFSLFCACKKDGANTVDLPVAEYNPDITHPEGSFYKLGEKLKAEGGLSVLGEDFLKLMIEGKEIEFLLTDNALKQIGYFNQDKKNLRIKKGTMLVLTYTIENLVYVAQEVEILTSN